MNSIRILAICMLIISSSIFVMDEEVTLPSESDLMAIFQELRLEELAEHTGIVKQLADQQLIALGINTKVTLAFCQYEKESERTPIEKRMTAMLKDPLVRKLLQAHPNAVRELEQDGLLKKRAK